MLEFNDENQNTYTHKKWSHKMADWVFKKKEFGFSLMNVKRIVNVILTRNFFILFAFFLFNHIVNGTGTVRWKIVKCNSIYVQSSSNRWPIVFTICTKRKCFIFRAYATRPNVTGKYLDWWLFCRQHKKKYFLLFIILVSVFHIRPGSMCAFILFIFLNYAIKHIKPWRNIINLPKIWELWYMCTKIIQEPL